MNTYISSPGQLSFINKKVQRASVITLLRLIAGSSADVRSTSALAGDDVAGIFVGTTRIAITGFASITVFG